MNASFSRKNIHNILNASGIKERFIFLIWYFLFHVKFLFSLLPETNTTFKEKKEMLKKEVFHQHYKKTCPYRLNTSSVN